MHFQPYPVSVGHVGEKCHLGYGQSHSLNSNPSTLMSPVGQKVTEQNTILANLEKITFSYMKSVMNFKKIFIFRKQRLATHLTFSVSHHRHGGVAQRWHVSCIMMGHFVSDSSERCCSLLTGRVKKKNMGWISKRNLVFWSARDWKTFSKVKTFSKFFLLK